MSYERFSAPENYRDSLSPSQVDDYIAAAENYYTNLPYHNWDHALAVIDGVEKIADKLQQRGVFIARGALKVAAAWHDAGFSKNHWSLGFSTKEDYSAALLNSYLKNKPVPDYVKRDFLLRPIAATSRLHSGHRTPTDLILHRADIANIGGPTNDFINISRKLWHENYPTYATDQTTLEKHLQGTKGFVEACIAEHDLESLSHSLTTDDTTLDVYDDIFETAAHRNLEALAGVAIWVVK